MNEASTRSARRRRQSAIASPTAAISSTGPSPLQSRCANATGAEPSCSNPSQPARASLFTREASAQACRGWITTNGLVTTNPTTRSPSETASRRNWWNPTTASGTASSTPGYLNPVATPAARPAHSSRPVTARASDTATAAVSGTSVTATWEYATWVEQTATAAAATSPARRPYATRPSHQDPATAPTPKATMTRRAARYDGSCCHAWNGASTYIRALG